MIRRYRARYVEVTVDEDDQAEDTPNTVIARTQDGQLSYYDSREFADNYVPIHVTTVDLSEGLG